MRKRVLSIILLVCIIAAFCPVQAQADYILEITLPAPVVGEKPCSSVSYTSWDSLYFTDICWYEDGKLMDSTDTFKSGKTYRVFIYFIDDDHTEVDSATVNGAKAHVYQRVEEMNIFVDKITVDYTFTALPDPITSVAVTITPPSVGAKPDYNPVLPSGANYYSDEYNTDTYKNDVIWWDKTSDFDNLNVETDVFEAGHEYACYIYLTPKYGYEFSLTATATVNGIATEAVKFLDSGQLRVSFSFPALLPTAGWQINGGKYYYYENGVPVTGFKQISGKYYYFDNTGALKTGFIQYGSKYYYFSPSDGTLQTGVVQVGSNYYYFSPSTGALQTGAVQVGSNYYYFSPSTGALQTGIVKIGSNYYYFSPSNGALQTGWQTIGGKYYYFDPSTGAMKFGWLKYEGLWFYLSPKTGNPVTGTQTIDGKTYKFNSNGVCIG